MRSFQVFANMSAVESEAFFGKVKKAAPTIFTQSVQAASAALKTRPAFLLKQPFTKQAAAVRRALSRVAANPLADETLALYFLEVRKDLLVEWLDAAGVAHDEGTLTEETPVQPDADALREAVERFRKAEDDADRELLLRAFAAQSVVEWPLLDELVAQKLG